MGVVIGIFAIGIFGLLIAPACVLWVLKDK